MSSQFTNITVLLFSADYMVCPHNQLCYTNIDDESDFVSRGCTDKQMFNSIYFFCNYTGCNKEQYPNPIEKSLHARAINLRDDKPRRRRLYFSGSTKCDATFYSTFMIISKIIQYILYYLT